MNIGMILLLHTIHEKNAMEILQKSVALIT
jgi:hypothetical protein